MIRPAQCFALRPRSLAPSIVAGLLAAGSNPATGLLRPHERAGQETGVIDITKQDASGGRFAGIRAAPAAPSPISGPIGKPQVPERKPGHIAHIRLRAACIAATARRIAARPGDARPQRRPAAAGPSQGKTRT